VQKSLLISLVLIVVLFAVPWLRTPEQPEAEKPSEQEEAPKGDQTMEEPEKVPEKRDAALMLRVKLGDRVELMDMESYLRGVLRAEMPASFQQEALKAQAVAARTYALYKMENGPVLGHPEADACDDIGCCQAYRSESEAAEGWGALALQYEEKIRSAVAATDGEAVLYDGAPVLAVFHSSSAGATRGAEEVWSAGVPYLQSVASPEGAEQVPNYYSQIGFTPEEFRTLLLTVRPDALLGSDPSAWFTNIRQQETGTVDSLQVGGVTLTGVELRDLLGLRSAAFTISFADGQIVFSTTGYGHGVGMSQYGANVMAGEGKSYVDILTWYYSGTTVEVWPPENPRGTA